MAHFLEAHLMENKSGAGQSGSDELESLYKMSLVL